MECAASRWNQCFWLRCLCMLDQNPLVGRTGSTKRLTFRAAAEERGPERVGFARRHPPMIHVSLTAACRRLVDRIQRRSNEDPTSPCRREPDGSRPTAASRSRGYSGPSPLKPVRIATGSWMTIDSVRGVCGP